MEVIIIKNYLLDVEVVDEEMEDFILQLQKYLDFDLVKVKSIDGKVSLYETNLTINMTNNDILILDFKMRQMDDSSIEYSHFYINNNKYDFSESIQSGELMFDMSELYKKQLMLRLKKKD